MYAQCPRLFFFAGYHNPREPGSCGSQLGPEGGCALLELFESFASGQALGPLLAYVRQDRNLHEPILFKSPPNGSLCQVVKPTSPLLITNSVKVNGYADAHCVRVRHNSRANERLGRPVGLTLLRLCLPRTCLLALPSVWACKKQPFQALPCYKSPASTRSLWTQKHGRRVFARHVHLNLHVVPTLCSRDSAFSLGGLWSRDDCFGFGSRGCPNDRSSVGFGVGLLMAFVANDCCKVGAKGILGSCVRFRLRCLGGVSGGVEVWALGGALRDRDANPACWGVTGLNRPPDLAPHLMRPKDSRISGAGASAADGNLK